MLKTGLILVVFIYTAYAQAGCTRYRKLHGLIHLKISKWETTHVNKDPVEICEELPLHPQANIEVRITQNEKEFVTKIYRPVAGFWDQGNQEKSIQGGRVDLKYLVIDTFVPEWFQGAKIIFKDIDSQKILVEAKL